jgi:Mce-associated membrane protein
MNDDVAAARLSSPRGANLRTWVVPGLLGVIVLALLAVAGVVRSRQGNDVDPAMLVAARTQVTNFVSLDHRHAAADVDRVLELSTGTFKKEYGASRSEVVAAITDKKLVVTGTIPEDAAAVELVDDDHGQVLVAVDVTTRTPDGRTSGNRYRMRVVLERVHGRWLTSDVNQVG